MRRTEVECAKCGKSTTNKKYCSRSCSASVNGTLYPKRSKVSSPLCSICETPTSGAHAQYCSSYCRGFALRHDKYTYDEWVQGAWDGGQLPGWLRRQLLAAVKYACTQCGWNVSHPDTDLPPVEIDHIDGDALNNKYTNIRVLCPNCHALTSTHGSRNSQAYRAKHGLPDLGRGSARPKELARRKRV